MLKSCEMPIKYKIFIVLCYILPLLIDTANGELDFIWIIYLLPVLIFTYFSGLKPGILVAATGTLIHFSWETIELFSESANFDYHNFSVMLLVSVIAFAIAVLVGTLFVRVSQKDYELEQIALNLKTSLDSIPEGFMSLDKSLRITYINKVIFDSHSVLLDRFIGQKITDITPLKRIQPELLDACIRVLASSQAENFERYSEALNRWFEFRVYATQTGLTIIVKDISDRIDAYKMMHSSKEIFEKAFSVSPVPMALCKLDGKFWDVNKSFEELLGFSKEEMVEKNPKDLNLSFAFNGSINLSNRLQKSGSIRNFETQFRTKNQELKTGLFSFELVNLQGNLYVLGACNDITDLRRIQGEMIRLDRLNLIGTMAAGLGHEIRNPLTTVRGFLQLLGEDEEFAKAKERFDLMISELDQANAIITEFLSLAKTKPSKLEQANLNLLIEKLFPLVVADAVNNDKSILLDLNAIPLVNVDTKEIRQLLLNLVRNGLEAMNAGGVLRIKTFQENSEVILAIQDQGSGISKEVLDKLGTPFLSTKDSGTGLGLAVCYGIANRHNATIEVDSGNSGTTFSVKFREAC